MFDLRRACICASLCLPAVLCGQQPVLTRSYDNARTGANLTEVALTTANVRPATFGKLFERVVDGQVYAQPLLVPNLNIPGKGVRNVVFVATMNDSVYAFDADNPAESAPLWHRNFLGPGVTPVPWTDVAGYRDVYPAIGILSTPVIKLGGGGGTIYLTAKTKEGSGASASYVYRLHALDILTGANKPGSPVVLSASVPGTGDGSSGGVLAFNSKRQMQRPGLMLLNDIVYLAFASHADRPPYHGWILGYDSSTLALTKVFCTTPNSGYGGIWQSGQGLSADAEGNIYGVTGNGLYDPATSSYGDSFLKISTGGALTLLDHFAPFNEAELSAADADLGCTGVIHVPGTNLIVGGGKEGKLYLLDKANLGGHRTTDDNQIVQWWQAVHGHIHGSPVFWNSPTGLLMYVWSEFDKLKAYRFNGSTFATTPAYQSAITAPNGMPGGILSVSANGTVAGTGILWSTVPFAGDANWDTVPGVVRAFDAANLTEIWNSRMNPERDDLGYLAKYNPPTVFNGRLYVGTFGPDDASSPNKLVAYGLLPAPSEPPAAPRLFSANASSGQVGLTWSKPPTASTFAVQRATSPFGPFGEIATGLAGPTYINTGLTNGTTYYYRVVASNTAGDGPPSNAGAATPGSTAPLYRINSGGSATGGFSADMLFSGGNNGQTGVPVDTYGVINAAPVDVYRYERWRPCTYTFGSLTPGAVYVVRLHFAEIYWSKPGQRRLDAAINGSNVLSGFDIVQEAGFANIALVREFSASATTGGQIAVSLSGSAGSPDINPKISGLELLGSSTSLPGATTLFSQGADSSVFLSWNLVPGATSYNLYRGTSSGAESLTPIATGLIGGSYLDSGVSNGSPYFYYLRGVSPSGAGPRSNETTSVPGLVNGFAMSVSPPSVTAPIGGSAQATVVVSGAGGFEGTVVLSVQGLPGGATASFSPPAVTGSGSSTLTLLVGGGVAAGTYPLTIRGVSGTFEEEHALSLVVTNPFLSPPSNLVASAANVRVFLNWEAVAEATGYTVRRSTSSLGPFSVVASGVGSESFTDSDVTNGVRYHYTVTATNGAEESGLSNIASAMPRSKLTLNPLIDAYVQAGSSQNANFGSSANLIVKRGSNSGANGLNRCTYVKFDLRNVTTDPASASLVLIIDPASTPDANTMPMKVYHLPAAVWEEPSITWANAPGLNRANFSSLGTLAASASVLVGASSVTIDLTSFIAAHKGEFVTLQLMNIVVDGNYVVFRSRESASGKPELRMTWPAPVSFSRGATTVAMRSKK